MGFGISGGLVTTGLLGGLIILASCSGDQLSDDLVVSTSENLVNRLSEAGIQLNDEAAVCSAKQLTDAQATDLDEAADDANLDEGTSVAVADAVTECVGSGAIARSSLEPLAPQAASESIDCAADRLDDKLVRGLLSSTLQGEALTESFVELDVATALSLCLSPEELLATM